MACLRECQVIIRHDCKVTRMLVSKLCYINRCHLMLMNQQEYVEDWQWTRTVHQYLNTCLYSMIWTHACSPPSRHAWHLVIMTSSTSHNARTRTWLIQILIINLANQSTKDRCVTQPLHKIMQFVVHNFGVQNSLHIMFWTFIKLTRRWRKKRSWIESEA